jgi:antitoxin ParD1/3/4
MAKFDLSPHFEDYVREAVESGRYADADEVIRDALRLHEQREAAQASAAAALRRETAVGLADLEAGRTHPVADLASFASLTEPAE